MESNRESPKKRSKTICCVPGCRNSKQKDPNLIFYGFPGRAWEVQRRQKWINAIKNSADSGNSWMPSKYSRVCSAHFISGEKCDIIYSPDYIPSVFPLNSKSNEAQHQSLDRFNRYFKRIQKEKESQQEQSVCINMTSSHKKNHNTMNLICKGKPLPWQAREIIANVVNFFKKEAHYDYGLPTKDFELRTLQATGLSERMYRSIVEEAERIERGELCGFRDVAKSVQILKKTISPDKARMIRELVYNLYINEMKPPTLNNLMAKIQSENIPFDGSKTALWNFMRKIGFRWSSTKTNRKVIIESYKIRFKRINYLKRLLEYRQQNRAIVYVSETYIDSSLIEEKSKKSSRIKNNCLYLLHSGGEMGFICMKTLSMTFTEPDNNRDFLKWAKTKLIPNLPTNSVIIIDNTTYNSIVIDECLMYTKQDMLEWLEKRNVPCNADMTKPELSILIKKYRSQSSTYKLDQLLEETGHNVLKLPPYHPELNPMEKIWDTIKNSILSDGIKFKTNDLKTMIRKKCYSIIRDDWIQYCDDVKRIENDYLTNEESFDQISDDLGIRIDDIDVDDDNNDDDDDEDKYKCDDSDLDDVNDEDDEDLDGNNVCKRPRIDNELDPLYIKPEMIDDLIETNETNLCTMIKQERVDDDDCGGGGGGGGDKFTKIDMWNVPIKEEIKTEKR